MSILTKYNYRCVNCAGRSLLQPNYLLTVRKIGKDVLPKSLILLFHIVKIELEVYCLVYASFHRAIVFIHEGLQMTSCSSVQTSCPKHM